MITSSKFVEKSGFQTRQSSRTGPAHIPKKHFPILHIILRFTTTCPCLFCPTTKCTNRASICGITVCGNLTVSYLKYTMERLEKLYTKAEFYITVVGLTLSIVSLCAVIVTYFLFVELRSKLPGKIVINLSIALMFAQIVFMFDLFRDIKGDGCVSIAVILQFLFLSAFCWMNVMAFDVSRTFAGKSKYSCRRIIQNIYVPKKLL